jgi:hypothetical protein
VDAIPVSLHVSALQKFPHQLSGRPARCHRPYLGVEPDGVSLELNRFHRADAEALQEAGIAVRLSLPLPEKLAVLWQGGRGPLSTIRRCLRE